MKKKSIKIIGDKSPKLYIKNSESALKVLKENDNLDLESYRPFIREFHYF